MNFIRPTRKWCLQRIWHIFGDSLQMKGYFCQKFITPCVENSSLEFVPLYIWLLNVVWNSCQKYLILRTFKDRMWCGRDSNVYTRSYFWLFYSWLISYNPLVPEIIPTVDHVSICKLLSRTHPDRGSYGLSLVRAACLPRGLYVLLALIRSPVLWTVDLMFCTCFFFLFFPNSFFPTSANRYFQNFSTWRGFTRKRSAAMPTS